MSRSARLSLLGFILLVLSIPVYFAAQDETSVPLPAPPPPGGTYFDAFDDGVVGPEYTPVGGAVLTESGGQLIVQQSAPGDGVLVTFPAQVNGEDLDAFCILWGMDIEQLAQPGDYFLFRAFENPEKVRWEVKKKNDTTWEYKVWKDGVLVAEGEARLKKGRRFRIDKKPGTDMIIGEVVFEDGHWETLWEKDPPPPEIPFTSFSITSNLDEFALDDMMAGLHTENPNAEGATDDLAVVALEDGGVVFTPLGNDFYDVEVTLETAAVWDSTGEVPIEVELQIGDPARTLRSSITCRGGGRGTCRGRSNCSTKTCPDRMYDLGDGQGFRPFVGTCKKAKLGLPVCSCTYKPKRRFQAVRILPNETVRVVVDPDDAIPEFVEEDNAVTARPSIAAFAATQSFSCTGGVSRTGLAARRLGTPGDDTTDRLQAETGESGVSIDTTIRIASGYFDPSTIDAGNVELLLTSASGEVDGPFPAAAVEIQGGVALVTFQVDPAAGVASCPDQMIVTGLTGSPWLHLWSATTGAQAVSDSEIFSQVGGLIALLDDYPPELMHLGTLRIVPNEITGQILAMGDLALPAVLDALSTGSQVQQAFAAYLAGELGNPTAVQPLLDRQAEIQAQGTLDTLDYTILGEINIALDKLQGGAQVPAGGDGGDDGGDPSETETPGETTTEEEKRCCAVDADAVVDGGFQGGNSLGTHFPYLAGAGGTSSYWSGDGTQAGDFDTGSRIGGAVQLIFTVEGDRACCTFTQHYVVEHSNYPGGDSAPVGQRTDDLAQSGQDQSSAPFRQNLGANQISFADPPSYPYDATSNFSAKTRFESCIVSYAASKPPCQWSKCCVTWILDVSVNNGAATSTVTEVGSFCE